MVTYGVDHLAEYAGLLAALTAAEADFRQESGEGFWLLAEEAGDQE